MLHLTLGKGSGVNLERQVKRQHRLALVTLLLPLPLDARCGYSFRSNISGDDSVVQSTDVNFFLHVRRSCFRHDRFTHMWVCILKLVLNLIENMLISQVLTYLFRICLKQSRVIVFNHSLKLLSFVSERNSSLKTFPYSILLVSAILVVTSEVMLA